MTLQIPDSSTENRAVTFRRRGTPSIILCVYPHLDEVHRFLPRQKLTITSNAVVWGLRIKLGRALRTFEGTMRGKCGMKGRENHTEFQSRSCYYSKTSGSPWNTRRQKRHWLAD